MPLPRSRRRILELFGQIHDDSLRNIISNVVDIEKVYRTSKVPIKKIEDIVDNEANLIEVNQREVGGNEI